MRYLSFLTLLFLLLQQVSQAQETNTKESKTGLLALQVRSTSFLRNKEYSNPVLNGLVFMGYMYKSYKIAPYSGVMYFDPNIEGYTLIGNFIEPALLYYPFKNLYLKFGFHLLNYSGTGTMSEIKPVIATKFNFSPGTSLTMGSLEGNEKHQMLDPLFDVERLYTNNSENGIEFETHSYRLFSDTWLDWEHFIFRGDTTQEVLTFGESLNYKAGKIGNLAEISIPLQLLIKHKGGQISNYSQHLETTLNFALGLNADFNTGNDRLRTGLELLHLLYFDNSSQQILSFGNGYADWLRLKCHYRPFYFEVSYWQSHNFYAPNGNLMYSSISGYENNTILSVRKILGSSGYLKLSPSRQSEINLGFDFYYDLSQKKLFSAMALHLNLSGLIKLAGNRDLSLH
jgi:hypothetical protein